MSLEEESLAWRRQVLEEATRLRGALRDAQQKRQAQREEEEKKISDSQNESNAEMEKFEEAQARLQKNTSRLLELRRQVEGSGLSSEAEAAHLERLQMAQEEMEKTTKRIAELEKLDEEEDHPEDEEQQQTDSTSEPSVPTTESNVEEEEEEEEEEEPPKPKPVVPRIRHTESMMLRAEETWKTMKDEAPSARASVKESVPEESSTDDEFAKPAPKGPATFDMIRQEMQLTSSPLVFFNLACFQGTQEAEQDVMHPICGYAVAGRLLAVMGPPGTDTSTLRVALSDFPKDANGGGQRDVLVADFTVADLVDVADSILRPENLAPADSLVTHLGLDNVADVQIGTCIQRGAGDGSGTMGTPRGSRNPDSPTPRNPTTPRFRGSQAAVQKSVLLMEDLMAVLDAESIFRVLKVLRKIAHEKRASVIVTLNKPFERRGLCSLFDDILFFTEEGVSYFGPVKRFGDYLNLIETPCPDGLHITDHVLTVSNAAAKYEESPIKQSVDAVILEYTGAREQADDTPRESDDKPVKKSAPLVPRFRRKKKKKTKADKPEEELPEMLQSENPGMSSRAKRLAAKLAEERRKEAARQQADEKLAVWNKLAELDMHIARGSGTSDESEVTNFEQMLLDLQKDTKRQRPSCFMNLACFMNIDNNPDRMVASIIQPTCAFANEGSVMGVMGPEGSDAGNLLASLRFGSETVTTVTDMSVRDTLKLSEFLKNREKADAATGLDSSVEILMAKMMLTSVSGEVVGTLIQRGSDKAASNTQIEIGDKVLSTAVRSILLLDRIHELDAQSLFVVLKLLKRIAVPARLAIIFMVQSPEEAKGLFPLLDNVLVFGEEGVMYFGPAKHLTSYCALVGFSCPNDKHVTEHVLDVMTENSPSSYELSETNINTPYTVRYQHSALAKYNKGIIEMSTKPQSEGGGLSSRTFVPKSFRKKTARVDQDEAIMEQAELARQKHHRQLQLKLEHEDKQRSRDQHYEEVWRKLAESDQQGAKLSFAGGLEQIVQEMDTGDQKPSLFFNLACFLPNMTTERIDMMQPICGYALIGRIVAILGPQETDLTSFLSALSGGDPATARGDDKGAVTVADGTAINQEMPPPATPGSAAVPSTPRMEVLHRVLTVLELLKIAEGSRPDRGSQPLHESAQTLLMNLGLEEFSEVRIGTFIQRGLTAAELGQAEETGKVIQVPSILMLDQVSEGLNPQASFVILKLVKRIAAQAQMAVIVHLPKEAERRGLFPLLDDALVFDTSGVAYFGPANRLRDYMTLMDLPCPDGTHETDYMFQLMTEYQKHDPTRGFTATSPPVRYKYSPLAKHVKGTVDRYTGNRTGMTHRPSEAGSVSGKPPGMSKTRSIAAFVPRGSKNKRLSRQINTKKMEEEEAAARRERIAEEEAEAERQRVAEADAEAVWQKMKQLETTDE